MARQLAFRPFGEHFEAEAQGQVLENLQVVFHRLAMCDSRATFARFNTEA